MSKRARLPGVNARWLLPWALPVLVGVLTLAPVLVWLAVTRPGELTFIDWHTYAMGGQRLLAGESLYISEQLAGPYQLPAVTPAGYIYPPPSAVLFLPFALPTIGLAAWVVLNATVLLIAIVSVVRHELGALRPLPLALALAGLLVVVPLPGSPPFSPLSIGIGTANVNVALAGLVGLCWVAGTRRGWIPYVAGVAAAFKAFPAALAVWAWRTHGWRAFVAAAGVALLLSMAALPLAGFDEWSRFAVALSNAQPTCDEGRLSIACLAMPLVGATAAKLVGVGVAGALLVAAMLVRQEYPAFVLLTLGMLAPIADGHVHYWLFVYVLVLIGLSRYVARRRSSAALARRPTADSDPVLNGAPAHDR